MELDARFVEQHDHLARYAHAVARHRLADGNAAQACRLERGDDVMAVRRMHLQHCAQLFVEERRDRRAG